MFEKKCTLKQINSVLILVSIIPTLRLLSISYVHGTEQSVWLLPIISAVIFIPFMIMQCYMVNSTGYKNYMQINDLVYGKVIGRAVTFLYFIWAVILCAYGIRLFAERISNTLFPYTDALVFISFMLFLCAYSIRLGTTASFRTASIFVVLVVLTLGLGCFFLLNQIDVKKLTPTNLKDIVPLFQGILPCLAVLVYFILTLFFIDNVEEPKKLVLHSSITVAIIAAIQTILIVIPVGLFGSTLAFKMNSPFFEAVKNINVFGAIEKMDAIIVVVLMLADFIVILAFIFAAIKALAHIAEIKDVHKCSNILLIFIALLTFSMAKNYFNLKALTESIILYGNLILGGVFPIILFIVGKIRKVFPPISAQRQ